MDSFEATKKTLATRLRSARKDVGLSQEALALDSGVQRTFVSQIERRIGNPSLNTLCRLADSLAVPCRELLTPETPERLRKS